MKVLVISGKSRSGKTTVASLIADMLKTTATDISTILIDEYVSKNGLDLSEIKKNKGKYLNDLRKYGLSVQTKNPDYFVRKALERGDVVAGIRPRIELEASKDLFDIIIYVIGRGEVESADQELKEEDAVYVIDNSGSIEDTKKQIVKIFHNFGRI